MKDEEITLFMCGDVMTGRGIDQVLPHPNDARIHEAYLKSAVGYVELAEKENGPIEQPVDFSYIWGEALDELQRVAPDLRLINLETSVTQSDDAWRGKGIHYRMNPKNAPCLTAAEVDFCSLANNHILDWGYAGLRETKETLDEVGIESAGAGCNRNEAETPTVRDVEGKGRLMVFALGSETSGIPPAWAAGESEAGVNLLQNYSRETVQYISETVKAVKREGDVVVASLHWGGNWGYRIPRRQRRFAHSLIDEAGIDVIHGHSSHHVKGIEVYRNRLILYGCGDFLTDYEGISGHESYRDDLGLMYFARVAPDSGRLVDLQMTPTQIKRFQVQRAPASEAKWLRDVLNRDGSKLGTQAQLNADRTLTLQWR